MSEQPRIATRAPYSIDTKLRAHARPSGQAPNHFFCGRERIDDDVPGDGTHNGL